MTRFTGASVLALCAITGPAWADVTPQQVWDDLKSYMSGFGYDVSASESLSGGVLSVSDVTMSVEIPDGEGAFAVTMDQITFSDQGDGSVAIDFPAVMPIAMTITPEGEDTPVSIKMDYSQQALAMIVSGETDAMIYEYSADEMAMTLSEMTVEGVTITGGVLDIDVVMGPVSGRSASVRDGGIQSIAQDATFGDIAYTAMFDDPESEDKGSFVGSLADVQMEGSTDIPENLDMTDPLVALAAGFGATGVLSHSGGALEFDVNGDGDMVSGQISSTSGSVTFQFAEAILRYAISGTGTNVSLSVPDLPFPITAQMAESLLDLTLPMKASDTPLEAALAVTLGGFEMSDMIWGMVDPAAALPRDPATVSVDLTAMVTPFVSLIDEESMTKLGETGGVPGELNSVTLNTLVVDAVGGRISGEGAFTFDNSDLTSFDGLPRPEGEVALEVAGANGLIDKLINMGLLSSEDAMGARMMLSMFTVPGDAADTASSKIVINEQGHILANGQRIR